MAAGRVQCRRPTCLGTSRRAPEGAYEDARLGAALAYYSVFSLGPRIVIAVAIAGLLFRHDALRGCKLLLHERSEGAPVTSRRLINRAATVPVPP